MKFLLTVLMCLTAIVSMAVSPSFQTFDTNQFMVNQPGNYIGLKNTNSGSGNPAGTNGQIQINNGGVFGGLTVGSGLSVSNGMLLDTNINGSGTPGGSSGQLQVNNNGAFGGVTVGSGLSLSAGTLSATGGGGSASIVAGQNTQPRAVGTNTAIDVVGAVTNVTAAAVNAAVPGIVTNISGLARTNFVVPAGPPALATLRAQAPDFVGQLAIVQNGGVGGFYLSAGSTTSAGGFNMVPYWPDGFGDIGNVNNMNLNSPSGSHWYFNGNPSSSTKAGASTHNEGYLFSANMNPYSDGSGFSAPMVTTSAGSGGSIVLTNSDGTNIYLRPFGMQMLSIPPEFVEGETNQAGSYALLAQPDFPLYISVNAQFTGETFDFFSQHGWVGFDCSGAENASLPLGVHFMKWQPYVWTFTNALNIDSLFVDERFGDINVYHDVNIITGGIKQTNAGVSIFGPASGLNGITGVADYFTTNVAWTPLVNSGAFTWDGQGNARVGVVLQGGQFAKFVSATNAPFIIGHSTATSLMASSQTITTDESWMNGTDTVSGVVLMTNVNNVLAGNGNALKGTSASITSSNASVIISPSIRPDGRTNYDLTTSGGGFTPTTNVVQLLGGAPFYWITNLQSFVNELILSSSGSVGYFVSANNLAGTNTTSASGLLETSVGSGIWFMKNIAALSSGGAKSTNVLLISDNNGYVQASGISTTNIPLLNSNNIFIGGTNTFNSIIATNLIALTNGYIPQQYINPTNQAPILTILNAFTNNVPYTNNTGWNLRGHISYLTTNTAILTSSIIYTNWSSHDYQPGGDLGAAIATIYGKFDFELGTNEICSVTNISNATIVNSSLKLIPSK